MRIPPPLEEIARKAKYERLREQNERLSASFKQMNEAFKNFKPALVLATDQFVEAAQITRYRMRIEMERQMGLMFVRNKADEVRDELGLPRLKRNKIA